MIDLFLSALAGGGMAGAVTFAMMKSERDYDRATIKAGVEARAKLSKELQILGDGYDSQTLELQSAQTRVAELAANVDKLAGELEAARSAVMPEVTVAGKAHAAHAARAGKKSAQAKKGQARGK